jgi:selenocysteine lyase/cysteine desulfurase
MVSRREFLSKSAIMAAALPILKFNNPLFAEKAEEKLRRVNSMPPEQAASDEDFWAWVRESFTITSKIVYLNSGGVSAQPKVVQDAFIRDYQLSNEGPSYYMWRIVDQGREPLRSQLADLAGVSAEEIAINRNTTEGLNTIIFGLNLKAGDEVVLCKYDYPNMMHAWKQREKREGIKLVWVDLNLPNENEQELVNAYANAITSKTKIVHITHIINWMGQIMPSKAIADIAHAKGCEVIVDGAHSFAHFDYKIPDTGADYFATSLHKWLNAPFGSGMMYVKKEKIKNVWALLSAPEPDGEDIRKFESIGTRNMASEMAISDAINFHLLIGAQRKEARLRYLKDYWCNKVKALGLSNVKIETSLLPKFSCAIANFSVDGWKADAITSKLFDDKKVFATAIEYEKLNSVRVTPSIYSTTSDLDKLVDGIVVIAKAPVPEKK